MNLGKGASWIEVVDFRALSNGEIKQLPAHIAEQNTDSTQVTHTAEPAPKVLMLLQSSLLEDSMHLCISRTG